MLRSRTLLVALLAWTGLAACEEQEKDCPAGQARCDGTCRDTRTDPLACGTCGFQCPQGASCVDGRCACPAGQEACGSRCVDLQADAQNCGECGRRCTAAGGAAGTCVAGDCDCGPNATCGALDPICRDLQSDPGACGDCARACTRGGAICDAGSCACPPARPDLCDPPDVAAELCTNLLTDAQNCGGCGDACTRAGAICAAGGCACPAEAPTACDLPTPVCANTSTDTAHCGRCGERCATGATCSGGACACPASAPTTCGAAPGTCVDTRTSALHCGTCGNACASGQSCRDGSCCTTCPSGACQTQHQNGAGGFYLDCNPLGTYTAAAAQAAASSWQAAGTPVDGLLLGCGSTACLGWRTPAGVGVWCWGVNEVDPFRGRMRINPDSTTIWTCPQLDSPTWN